MIKDNIPYISVRQIEQFALKVIEEAGASGLVIKRSLLLYDDTLIEIPDDFFGEYFIFHFYIDILKFEVSLTVAEVKLPFMDEDTLNNLYRMTLRGLPNNYPALYKILVDINEHRTGLKRGRFDN